MARAVMQAAQAAGIDPALAIANLPTLTDPKAIAAATEVTASVPPSSVPPPPSTATDAAGTPTASDQASAAASSMPAVADAVPKDVQARTTVPGRTPDDEAQQWEQWQRLQQMNSWQHQHQAAHLIQQQQIQQQRAPRGVRHAACRCSSHSMRGGVGVGGGGGGTQQRSSSSRRSRRSRSSRRAQHSKRRQQQQQAQPQQSLQHMQALQHVQAAATAQQHAAAFNAAQMLVGVRQRPPRSSSTPLPRGIRVRRRSRP